MKAIWTKSKAEYHGEMVNFDPMMAWPKPAQKPHPPILVGGAFPYGARRALRYGDGWMPLRSRKGYPEVRDLFPKFREMAKEANRDLATVPISIWSAKEDEDQLKRDRDEGVVRVVISLEIGQGRRDPARARPLGEAGEEGGLAGGAPLQWRDPRSVCDNMTRDWRRAVRRA